MKRAGTILICLMILAFTYPARGMSEAAFDPGADPLLRDVAERSHSLHDNSLGYPGNEDIRLDGFYEWFAENRVGHAMLNNAGDPNDVAEDHGALRIENEVIRFFAPYYGFSRDEVWGLVTMSGTDGNNHGIYFGRHYLAAETGKEPVLYVSAESHYSNMRLAELQQIEVRMIETDRMGRMVPEAFRAALDPDRPALIVFSMGTTFKGATDDQRAINEIVSEVGPPAVYRHVDAALFGGYLPFSRYAAAVDRRICGFDSIAVSGHKFFGMDEPCGLFFTTRKVMEKQNPYQITYLNGSMPMINCSRSALSPLKFYWLIQTVGAKGFGEMADSMLENAAYLKARLDGIGWPAWIASEMSNTVFFARPSDEIMEKYTLAPDQDDRFGDDLAHVVVMGGVTKEQLDRLVEDLEAEMAAAEKPAA